MNLLNQQENVCDGGTFLQYKTKYPPKSVPFLHSTPALCFPLWHESPQTDFVRLGGIMLQLGEKTPNFPRASCRIAIMLYMAVSLYVVGSQSPNFLVNITQGWFTFKPFSTKKEFSLSHRKTKLLTGTIQSCWWQRMKIPQSQRQNIPKNDNAAFNKLGKHSIFFKICIIKSDHFHTEY